MTQRVEEHGSETKALVVVQDNDSPLRHRGIVAVDDVTSGGNAFVVGVDEDKSESEVVGVAEMGEVVQLGCRETLDGTCESEEEGSRGDLTESDG